MTEDCFRKGKSYEILIRTAHNCEKGRKLGADSELYIELVRLELENNNSIEYKWHFQKLKKYLMYALSKLRKRKRYLESDNAFSPIQVRLNRATDADDLAKIASLGFAKIIEYEKKQRKSS